MFVCMCVYTLVVVVVLESNSLCLIDLDRTFFASLLLIFHAQNLFEKKKRGGKRGTTGLLTS